MDARQIWFNRDGHPIDAVAANALLGDREYQRVALARVTSTTDPGVSFTVSTVWLGINYNFGDGDPIIFETMVFGGEEAQNEACYRWATEQAARDGHAEIVASVAATVTDERVEDLPGWPVSLAKRDR
jgi:hypothetical protein